MPRVTLRAVSADEKPRAPKTLGEAVASGTYLEILQAQQREIASTVGEERGPAKAALHRQLALLSKEIEALLMVASQEAAEDAEVSDEAFDAEAL